MATDFRGGSRIWIDPTNGRAYHEAYLKLTPDKVVAAEKALFDPTERDIVKYWEAKEA